MSIYRVRRANLRHLARLSCGCKDTAPQPPVGINLFAHGDGKWNRHMGVLPVPVAHHRVGASRHARMHRVVTKE